METKSKLASRIQDRLLERNVVLERFFFAEALEPANIIAVGNDIGTDAIFVRQLIAHGGSARG